MTTPPPLRQRPLMPGRGRVYRVSANWYADYRATNDAIYGSYAESPAEAADWIRNKAMEATK